jgi:hypothetical protein
VTRAAPVHPHLDVRPALRQRAGRPRVVQVDVGQEDRRRLPVAQLGQQRLHRRLRPGVDDDVLELVAADDERDAEVQDVDVTHG